MILLSLLLAAAPNVKYVVKVEPRSWQPVDPPDVERVIEQKALAPLSAKGLLRLEKGKFSDLQEGDFSVMMEGRFIEDAGKFSVYLTFTPQKSTTAPSVYVIDTAAVEEKSPQQIQAIIATLTDRAAKRMTATLEPHLGGTVAQPLPVEVSQLPLEWGEIEIPSLKSPSGALKDLTTVRNEDHVRWNGFNELKAHAFDQPTARMALELCVLQDPLPRLRASCVEALAPIARTRVETQRFLLHAMRTDVEEEVIKAIAEVSKSFVGLSRKEALATWMQVMSDDATPEQAARAIGSALQDENGLPNLELATSKCLLSEALTWQKRDACADVLLKKVAKDRQLAVAWRYLETAKLYDQGESMTYKDVVETIAGRSGPVDARLADMLLQRATRRDLAGFTHDVVYMMQRHPSPSLATFDTLLVIAKRRKFASGVFRTIGDIARKQPALKPGAIAALKKFDNETTYMTMMSHGDPKKDLADVLKRLEK